jgi:hypothetical protein
MSEPYTVGTCAHRAGEAGCQEGRTVAENPQTTAASPDATGPGATNGPTHHTAGGPMPPSRRGALTARVVTKYRARETTWGEK